MLDKNTRWKHFLNQSHIPRRQLPAGRFERLVCLLAFRAIMTALAHHTITPCILCENIHIRKPFAISQYLAAVVNANKKWGTPNLTTIPESRNPSRSIWRNSIHFVTIDLSHLFHAAPDNHDETLHCTNLILWSFIVRFLRSLMMDVLTSSVGSSAFLGSIF